MNLMISKSGYLRVDTKLIPLEEFIFRNYNSQSFVFNNILRNVKEKKYISFD